MQLSLKAQKNCKISCTFFKRKAKINLKNTRHFQYICNSFFSSYPVMRRNKSWLPSGSRKKHNEPASVSFIDGANIKAAGRNVKCPDISRCRLKNVILGEIFFYDIFDPSTVLVKIKVAGKNDAIFIDASAMNFVCREKKLCKIVTSKVATKSKQKRTGIYLCYVTSKQSLLCDLQTVLVIWSPNCPYYVTSKLFLLCDLQTVLVMWPPNCPCYMTSKLSLLCDLQNVLVIWPPNYPCYVTFKLPLLCDLQTVLVVWPPNCPCYVTSKLSLLYDLQTVLVMWPPNCPCYVTSKLSLLCDLQTVLVMWPPNCPCYMTSKLSLLCDLQTVLVMWPPNCPCYNTPKLSLLCDLQTVLVMWPPNCPCYVTSNLCLIWPPTHRVMWPPDYSHHVISKLHVSRNSISSLYYDNKVTWPPYNSCHVITSTNTAIFYDRYKYRSAYSLFTSFPVFP